MSWKDSVKEVICEFLRTRMTDPRSRSESSNSDTFSGTGASQTLTLSPTSGSRAYAITAVNDGSALNKWEDYDIDLQNQQVSGTFTAGTDNITVTYKEGTSGWIFPSLSSSKIQDNTKFPRIDVTVVSAQGVRIGNYEAPMSRRIHFQANVWVKKNYVTSAIDSVIYSGSSLAMYLAEQIDYVFNHYIDDLNPKLFDYTLLNIRDATWEKSRQLFHVIVEFELVGVDVNG